MLSMNRKNCHMTQRIGIRLKIVEKYSISRTWLIKYNWVQLHDDRYACADKQQERDRYLSIIF